MALAIEPVEDIRPLTYDDLLATPDDDQRYEIIGGELVVSPSPGIPHQRLAGELYALLRDFVRSRDLGVILFAPVDVRLTMHDIVVPDLVYVSRERAAIVGERAIEGAPDLVVEIVSPTSKGRDRVRKAALYATAGVREYGIVDPDARALEMYRLRDGRYERIPAREGGVRSEVLPGWTIEPARLFGGPGNAPA